MVSSPSSETPTTTGTMTAQNVDYLLSTTPLSELAAPGASGNPLNLTTSTDNTLWFTLDPSNEDVEGSDAGEQVCQEITNLLNPLFSMRTSYACYHPSSFFDFVSI